jgi:hypothetical protein
MEFFPGSEDLTAQVKPIFEPGRRPLSGKFIKIFVTQDFG